MWQQRTRPTAGIGRVDRFSIERGVLILVAVGVDADGGVGAAAVGGGVGRTVGGRRRRLDRRRRSKVAPTAAAAAAAGADFVDEFGGQDAPTGAGRRAAVDAAPGAVQRRPDPVQQHSTTIIIDFNLKSIQQ